MGRLTNGSEHGAAFDCRAIFYDAQSRSVASSGAALAHEPRHRFIFRLDVLCEPVGDEFERGDGGLGISGFGLSLQFVESDHEAVMGFDVLRQVRIAQPLQERFLLGVMFSGVGLVMLVVVGVYLLGSWRCLVIVPPGIAYLVWATLWPSAYPPNALQEAP